MSAQSVLTREGLIESYQRYGSPSRLVGAELERHLLRPDGLPVPYFGPRGVRWLLERLAENGTWKTYYEGEHLIALFRGRASVTLEPGSQFELSTDPHASVAEIERETRAFRDEVSTAIGEEPLHQVALGFTPFARIEDIAWVPKGRYAVMREHLGRTGPLAHHMMKGTCAVQASFDFADERDCAEKVQLATSLGPLTTAMFANSPLSEGRLNGWASWRGHVWTRTDPARTGFPAAADAFSFERWVDYLLDAPMMFLQRDGAWRPANGQSFRAWMEGRLDATRPTEADWDLHLTSVFPEVRVKKQIEVRGADCVPLRLALAFCALFEGLFYSDDARQAALEVGRRFRACGTKDERFEVACRAGLAGEVGGRRLAAWAADVVEIARGGLARHAPGDLPYLEPLEEQVARGVSPSADVVAAWERDPSPMSVIRANGWA